MTRGTGAVAILFAAACGGSVASSPSDAGATPANGETPLPSPAPMPSPAPSGGLPPPPPGEAWQLGAFRASAEVHVTVGPRTTTTKPENGRYQLLVPRGVPITTEASGPGYWTMLDQAWTVDQEIVSRPTLSLLESARAETLASVVLRDPTKGVVLVKIFAEPPCTTIAGATVTLDPPGSAKLVYLDAKNVPDFDLTAAVAEASVGNVSAVFYDVEPDVPFTIGASSASCAMRPFPHDHTGVQLTGKAIARAGNAYTFFRVMIGAP